MNAVESGGVYRAAAVSSSWRFRLSSVLLNAGFHEPALNLLKKLDQRSPEDPIILSHLVSAATEAGRPEAAGDYEAQLQRLLAVRAVSAELDHDKLVALLGAAGRLSELNLAIPRKASRTIARLLADADRSDLLISACEEATRQHPANVLITYAYAFALARGENFDRANAVVKAAVRASKADPAVRDLGRDQSRFAKILRMVDAISRDKMAWSAKEASAQVETTAEATAVTTEALLQARMQAPYLEACWTNFETAANTPEKITAIRAMIRQGLRREPSYHDAYDQARRAYSAIRGEWAPLLGGGAALDGMNATASAKLLIQIHRLAEDLGFIEDAKLVEQALVSAVGQRQNRTMLWAIADALVRIDSNHAEYTASRIAAAPAPRKEHEIRSLLSWALHSRRHGVAHEFFKTAPATVRQSYAVYEYVRILQREGRFARALALCDEICATLVQRPAQFDPWRHWSLIRRADELKFLQETTVWFKKVPQPKEPKGIVMLAPRNAQQLTKYPLVVLMELKRQGWAIIPLVQGVMPHEKTGDPRIDKFIGCITQDGQIDPERRHLFEEIDDLVADLPRGRLAWAGTDMSQVLWEEAAINRRRFHVDFTCPALQPFLSRLVDWTRVIGTVLHTARREFSGMRLRAGTIVPFQARLPDAIVRFYCQERGDPSQFFCIHATNGYENYFANFSRPYSMKAGLRNVTAHPELRTASFPVPKDFMAWYEARKAFGAENLASVQAVTEVRRAAREEATPPPEALAFKERVREWKDGGGRVVCMFGKVVCDLAAPTDGGPAHSNMKDWINHTVDSVRGSRTLLLIKPHPHELRDEIATFLTERLTDLIQGDLPSNVVIAHPDWFDLKDITELVDLGVIYNGTTAIELGLVRVPAVLCSNYAPIDYPIGHVAPLDRDHYRKLLRFEETASVPNDLAERAAAWIHYMSGERLAVPYRYHFRPLTNKLESSPHWFDEDIVSYLDKGDPYVSALSKRITIEMS